MTIEKVIELLSRDYWFEDEELKEAKRIAVEILVIATLFQYVRDLTFKKNI